MKLVMTLTEICFPIHLCKALYAVILMIAPVLHMMQMIFVVDIILIIFMISTEITVFRKIKDVI